ncbi:hypothetical protein Tco_1107737 [Tanacetum coccineum]
MMVITLMLISLDSRKLGLNSRCETSLAKLAKDVVRPNLTHLRSNVKNVRPLNKAHGLRDYMLDYAYEDALVRKLGLNSRCEASLAKLAKDVVKPNLTHLRSNVKKVRPWNKAHGLRNYMLDYAYEVSVSSRARIDVEPPSKVNWFVNVLVKCQESSKGRFSLNEDEKKEILGISIFKVEKLPIKYLGVPITSKGLGIKECKSLTDKVETELDQNDGTKGSFKVAWKNHLWHIVIDKESLWVKWINTEKLKGRSIWEIEVEKTDSWGWRNILNQRKDARRRINSKVGNSRSTSLWYDNWSSIVPLDQFISNRDMYDERLSSKMTVSEMMRQSNWS